MRTKTIQWKGAGSGFTSWTAEKNCRIIGFTIATGSLNVLVSTNPTAIASDLTSPAATVARDDLLYYAAGSSTVPAFSAQFPLNFPIAQGEVIWFHFSATGGVLMFLEDEPTVE